MRTIPVVTVLSCVLMTCTHGSSVEPASGERRVDHNAQTGQYSPTIAIEQPKDQPEQKTATPDTIEIVLDEYSFGNYAFRSIVDSVSLMMRTCHGYDFGSIGTRRTSKGLWVELTIRDQNAISPSATGYFERDGRMFALLGTEHVGWFEKTGKARTFRYVDHKGIPDIYDPPVWYFQVRGDSIHQGVGSGTPCD